MASLQLTRPSAELEQEFLALVAEVAAAREVVNYGCLHATAEKFIAAGRDFAAFRQRLLKEEQQEHQPAGLVPQTTFWLVRNSATIVGESRLRHYLNDHLELEGGHIGYAIRPSERHKGHGTLILQLSLAKAREIGLSRVLLTCDKHNLASARIIQKNGGELTSEGVSPRDGNLIQRYRIEL